jgi:transcriptional repressor NrdR
LNFPCVIKRSGSVVEFDCGKVRRSVVRALDKDQWSGEAIGKVISRILAKVLESKGEKIPSVTIGIIILDELRSQYPVAYMRYASVYKDFKSANEFASECRLMDAEREDDSQREFENFSPKSV